MWLIKRFENQLIVVLHFIGVNNSSDVELGSTLIERVNDSSTKTEATQKLKY